MIIVSLFLFCCLLNGWVCLVLLNWFASLIGFCGVCFVLITLCILI